jgi:hypothetical protein
MKWCIASLGLVLSLGVAAAQPAGDCPKGAQALVPNNFKISICTGNDKNFSLFVEPAKQESEKVALGFDVTTMQVPNEALFKQLLDRQMKGVGNFGGQSMGLLMASPDGEKPLKGGKVKYVKNTMKPEGSGAPVVYYTFRSVSSLGDIIVNANGTALSKEACDGWVEAVRSKLSTK